MSARTPSPPHGWQRVRSVYGEPEHYLHASGAMAPSLSAAFAASGDAASVRSRRSSRSARRERRVWREVKAKDGGRSYWWNRLTEVTTWTPPSAEELALRMPAPSSPTVTGGVEESEWRQAVDGSSGRVYYYSRLTKEVRWTPPDEDVAAAPTPAPAPVAEPPYVTPASEPAPTQALLLPSAAPSVRLSGSIPASAPPTITPEGPIISGTIINPSIQDASMLIPGDVSKVLVKKPSLSLLLMTQASELAAAQHFMRKRIEAAAVAAAASNPGAPQEFTATVPRALRWNITASEAGVLPLSIPNAALTPSALRLQRRGDLWKKGRSGWREWTKRYWVLHNWHLLYYHCADCPVTEPLGALDLRFVTELLLGVEVEVVATANNGNKPKKDQFLADVVQSHCLLELRCKGGIDRYSLHASSEASALAWHAHLAATMAHFGCAAAPGSLLYEKLGALAAQEQANAAAAAAAAQLQADAEATSSTVEESFVDDGQAGVAAMRLLDEAADTAAPEWTEGGVEMRGGERGAEGQEGGYSTAELTAVAEDEVVAAAEAAATMTMLQAAATSAEAAGPTLAASVVAAVEPRTSARVLPPPPTPAPRPLPQQQPAPTPVSTLRLTQSARAFTSVPPPAATSPRKRAEMQLEMSLALLPSELQQGGAPLGRGRIAAAAQLQRSRAAAAAVAATSSEPLHSRSERSLSGSSSSGRLELSGTSHPALAVIPPHVRRSVSARLVANAEAVRTVDDAGDADLSVGEMEEGEGGEEEGGADSLEALINEQALQGVPSAPSSLPPSPVPAGPSRRLGILSAVEAILGSGKSSSSSSSNNNNNNSSTVPTSLAQQQGQYYSTASSTAPSSAVPSPPSHAPLARIPSAPEGFSSGTIDSHIEATRGHLARLRDVLGRLDLASGPLSSSSVSDPLLISSSSSNSSSSSINISVSNSSSFSAAVAAPAGAWPAAGRSLHLPARGISAHNVPFISASVTTAAASAASTIASNTASVRAAVALVTSLSNGNGGGDEVNPQLPVSGARMTVLRQSTALRTAHLHVARALAAAAAAKERGETTVAATTPAPTLQQALAAQDQPGDVPLGRILRAMQSSPPLCVALAVSLARGAALGSLDSASGDNAGLEALRPFVRFLRISPLAPTSVSPLVFLRLMSCVCSGLSDTSSNSDSSSGNSNGLGDVRARLLFVATLFGDLLSWFPRMEAKASNKRVATASTALKETSSGCTTLVELIEHVTAHAAAVAATSASSSFDGGDGDGLLTALLTRLANDDALALTPVEGAVSLLCLSSALGTPTARSVLLRYVLAPILAAQLVAVQNVLMEEEEAAAVVGGGWGGNDASEASRARHVTHMQLLTEAGGAALANELSPRTSHAANALVSKWCSLGSGAIDFVPRVREALSSGPPPSHAQSFMSALDRAAAHANNSSPSPLGVGVDAGSGGDGGTSGSGLDALFATYSQDLPPRYMRPRSACGWICLHPEWPDALLPALLESGASALSAALPSDAASAFERDANALLALSHADLAHSAQVHRALRLPDEGIRDVAGVVGMEQTAAALDGNRGLLMRLRAVLAEAGLLAAGSDCSVRPKDPGLEAELLVLARRVGPLHTALDAAAAEEWAHADTETWQRKVIAELANA